MNEESRLKGTAIGGYIDRHLWAILAAGVSLYGGYLTGTTTVNNRLAILEEKVDHNSTRLLSDEGVQRRFMACTIRNIDRLSNQAGVQPACPMDIE